MAVVVYRERIKRAYEVNSKASLAYAFKIIALLITLIVPFVMAYASFGLWKKFDEYREQPQVAFTHDAIIYFDGHFLAPSETNQVVWSNIENFNDLNADRVRYPEVKSYGRIHIKNPIYIDAGGYGPGLSSFATGEMRLVQQLPFRPSGTQDIQPDPLVGPQNFTTPQDTASSTILKLYRQRNETLHFANAWFSWTPGTASEFSVEIDLNIVEDYIRYRPDAFEAFKFAWIQYFCFAAVVFVIMDAIQGFVYSERIIPTRVTSDFDKGKRF